MFRCLILLSVFACLIFVGCGGGSSEKPQQPASSTAPAHIDSRTSSNPSGAQPSPTSVTPTPQAVPGDQPPQITTARFETEGTTVHAVAETSDPDGDKVTLQYAWMVNDKKIDEKGDSLSGLNKGDHVQAVITPNDGKEDGPAKGLFVIIANQPPKITPTQPQYEDPNWSLQVKATDPDGDPLEYTLVKGPPGMRIDPLKGLVTWNTDGVADGKYSATVEVKDGHGGTSQYTYEVTLAPQ
jgi:Putative Ig domain